MYLYMGVATVKYLVNDSDTLVVAGLRSSKKKPNVGLALHVGQKKHCTASIPACRAGDWIYYTLIGPTTSVHFKSNIVPA